MVDLNKEQDVYVVFNKISGAFVQQIVQDGFDPKELEKMLDDNIYTEIKKLKFNPQTHMWDGGDIKTGKVVGLFEATPVVRESEINTNAAGKIEADHPIYKQINALTEAVIALIDVVGEEHVAFDTLKEIKEDIDQIKANNARAKESYKNNPSYKFLTKAEEDAELNAQMEGGIATLIGRFAR